MPSSLPLFRLTLCTAAVLFAWNASAQQAAPDANPATPADAAPAVQKVEVKGSGYDPRRDDTASKMVVDSEEILKYGDTNVTDVLKRLPGITVTGAAGRTGGEIRMRGLGSGYTQILLNGERAPAGFSLDTLSPDVIERIEILHAASAEYSTQSIAGTINVVLKKAVKTAQRELKLGLAGSRDSFSPTVNLQLSDRDGNFSYSMAGSLYRYDYHYDNPALELGYLPDGRQNLLRRTTGSGDGRPEGINLSPRLNWTLKSGDTVTAQFFVNVGRGEHRNASRAETELGARPDYDTNTGSSSNHNAMGRADLTWMHKLDGGARLELKLGATGARNTSDSLQRGYIDGAGLALERAVGVKATENGVSSTGKVLDPAGAGPCLVDGLGRRLYRARGRAPPARSAVARRPPAVQQRRGLSMRWYAGWRCLPRTTGRSRRAGRCMRACAGKASIRAAPAKVLTPCASAPASGARCCKRCGSCPIPRATRCAWH